MSGFPYLWFLFYTEIGRFILGVLIILMIITILGWWVIPAILALIAAIVFAESYDRIRINKPLLKSAEKKQNQIIQQNQKKIETYHQLKKDFPQAVGDVVFSDSKKRYNLYWLNIGKGEKGKDVFENKHFIIKFGIAKDYSGLVVSITNNSDKDMFVDWQSFLINFSRVLIDGNECENYPHNKPLASHETATRLLQPYNPRLDRKLTNLFNPKEMVLNDVLYRVRFDIKDGEGEVRTFEFKLFTQHKAFKLADNNDELTSYRKAIEKARMQLKIGGILFAAALLIALGIYFYNNRYKFYVADSPHIEYTEPEKVFDNQYDLKDTPSSTPNTEPSRHPDNMRGFDPASEDDMPDNGMTRYMEVNDDEGWD